MAKMMGKRDDVEKRFEAEKESYQRKEEKLMITLEQIGQNYDAQTRSIMSQVREVVTDLNHQAAPAPNL